MSYNLTVTVADGEAKAEILTAPGSVPDGVYQINGHDEQDFRSLAVTRHDGKGNVLAHAAAQVSRAG